MDRSGTVATQAPPLWRDRAGFCGMDFVGQPAGNLSAAQRATLREIAGRCRLGHDLLAAFADRYDTFPRQLVLTFTRELAAMQFLLGRYDGAEASTIDRGDPRDTSEYRRLLAEGSVGRSAALAVTARLAVDLIGIVEPALFALTAADVRHVYLHLLTSAHRQVRTVQAWGCR